MENPDPEGLSSPALNGVVTAEVVEGDPSFGWPLLVFLVIGAATIVLLMMRSAHDRQRFAHSDFPRDAS